MITVHQQGSDKTADILVTDMIPLGYSSIRVPGYSKTVYLYLGFWIITIMLTSEEIDGWVVDKSAWLRNLVLKFFHV